MEQFSLSEQQGGQKSPFSIDLSKYPLVEVTRSFPATAEKVWNAWSQPELVKQWWGPVGYSCPEAKIDFRVGGNFLIAMKSPDDKVTWGFGTYLELTPFERISCSDSFSDQYGNPVNPNDFGMPGNWPAYLRITIELVRTKTHQTIMHLKHEGIPEEEHDDCVEGWNSSLNKLEMLLKAN